MNVLDAARNMADEFEGGATALAGRIGKNHNTFLAELNQTGTAKLGLLTSVMASKAAKDWRVLNAFATELGALVLPLPNGMLQDGDQSIQDLGLMAKEFADVVQEVSRSCADGAISANELAAVERQWGELMLAGQRLMAGLRMRHEAGVPQGMTAR
jgi:hypothetical protein